MTDSRPAKYQAVIIIGLLFFIFGFVTYLNSILIPYFKLACSLTNKQAMLVAFAFYISYFIMAIPASAILKMTGLKNGMMLGLAVMAIGALVFLPAAMSRGYGVFLLGLFVQATGLTILQTASNPYITILGPIESAAKRICIMGICNKTAGAIAPLLLIGAITKNPGEIDELHKRLPALSISEQTTILNQLASRLIVPYIVMAAVLTGLALMIYLSALPDVEEKEEEVVPRPVSSHRTSIFQFPYLLFGAMAIFCAVSVEVVSVDSVINYGLQTGIPFKEAKYFASYTLFTMIIGYLFGSIAIPKSLSQKKALQWSAISGILLTAIALFTIGKISVWFICLLGLSNALLWPSIWPLALDGLGKFTKKGSALMIMGIAGGAITPLLYGWLSDKTSAQQGYWLLIPCYAFLLFFEAKGSLIGKVFRHLQTEG